MLASTNNSSTLQSMAFLSYSFFFFLTAAVHDKRYSSTVPWFSMLIGISADPKLVKIWEVNTTTKLKGISLQQKSQSLTCSFLFHIAGI